MLGHYETIFKAEFDYYVGNFCPFFLYFCFFENTTWTTKNWKHNMQT